LGGSTAFSDEETQETEKTVKSIKGNLRIRLREHYEIIFVRYGTTGEDASYAGLSNTANVWFEKADEYAIGFSLSPILGSATTLGNVPSQTNRKIRLWSIGAEAKLYFYPRKRGAFGRLGLTGNILDTRGPAGAIGGAGYYLGLGWEYMIGKMGLNPELAFRHVIFGDGGRALSFTVSIGVHFYTLSEDFLQIEF